MSTPVTISIVSYLNSKPFLRGLINSNFETEANIQLDIPSVCASKLINHEADIGLVPVAVLSLLPGSEIISDFCIGADGDVGSVLLLSDEPLNEIRTILLDYQSRTSVMLAKVLAKEFWKIEPQWLNTQENYERKITGATAGIVIGDRALLIKNTFKYVYDLSGEWKRFTSLPFVFAVWVSSKPFEKQFIDKFNNALSAGLNEIAQVAKDEVNDFLTEELIFDYLTNRINYDFDEKKKEALELFLKYISSFERANTKN